MAEGITLRITRAAGGTSSILIADLPQGTGGNNPYNLKAGPVYVPATGSIDIQWNAFVANSMETGALRELIDTGVITAVIVFATIFETAIIGVTGGDLDWKNSVRAATAAAINLAVLPANIDGVAMVAGDSFLAKNQGAGQDNGLYVWVGLGVPATRRTDFDESSEVTSQAAVRVEEGTISADVSWSLVTTGAIIVGTTVQVWGVVGDVAGAGLTKTVATLDVVANADGSMVINANDIQVGILATDAQHGNRGGGALHADAVSGGASGFLSGADLASLDLNTTHRTSTGADHTWIDQTLVSGAAPTFVATNFTGIAAGGIDPDATAHAAATGASHTWIDQTVVSGAAPTFVATNFTGIAAGGIDPDATAHAAATGASHTWIDQTVVSGAAPTFVATNFTGIAAGGIDPDATTHIASGGSTDHADIGHLFPNTEDLNAAAGGATGTLVVAATTRNVRIFDDDGAAVTLELPSATGSGREITAFFQSVTNGWGSVLDPQPADSIWFNGATNGAGVNTPWFSQNWNGAGITIRDDAANTWVVTQDATEALGSLNQVVYDQGGYGNGTLRVNAVPANLETYQVDMSGTGGSDQVYTFVNGAPGSADQIQIDGGATTATVAAALATAIDTIQGSGGSNEIAAQQHATDTTVVDWFLNNSSAVVVFTDGTTGDVVPQNRADERAQERLFSFNKTYTVTAEDATCGHLYIVLGGGQQGGTTIEATYMVRRANALLAHDGTVVFAEDVIEFDFDGATPIAAADVINVWGIASI